MTRIVAPEMVLIEAGEVVLGVPQAPDDYPLKHRWTARRVVFCGAFRVGRYPVTRAEYAAFLRSSGHEEPADWTAPEMDGDNKPVGGVSWEDAAAYTRWLSDETGEPYRLPRTDEWEKAARGRLDGKRFPWGDEPPGGRCCFGRPPEAGPEPVGSYAPNGFGLYDIAGGVWEWTADLYTDVAEDQPVNTPTNLPADRNRVLVGGSFMTPNDAPLWVAYRHEDPPDLRHRCIGFRVAL